jgi:hyperosmotically inducible protein
LKTTKLTIVLIIYRGLKMNARKILLTTLATVFIFGLAACEKKGPAETAGEKIDNAAEKMGDKIENATDKAGDKLESAGDKIEDKTD